MSVTERPVMADTQTIAKVDVNYRWFADGVLAIWMMDCDDLSTEDAFRVIKCAVDHWIDEEVARQKVYNGQSR